MRLGILGGAFNPPHIGHLIYAQEALIQLELDEVLFIPTARPPHREIEADPGAEERLALTELAIGKDDRFSVTRAELDRAGPSYTVDTLRELRTQRPDDELFLLLGGDQAASLPKWHEPEAVLELATVCAVERIGYTREAIGITLARLRGSERVRYIDMPLIQVSATMLRRRAAAGQALRYLVPAAVEDRIRELGLYRDAAQVGAG